MEVPKSLKASVFLAGYNPNNGKLELRVIAYLIVTFLIYVNSILYLKYNWDDMDCRIDSLKAMAFITLFLLYVIYFLLFWSDYQLVYTVVMEGFHYKYFCNYISDKGSKVVKRVQQEFLTGHKLFYYFMHYYILVVTSFPFIGTIFIIVKTKVLDNEENITVEKLPLFYPVYYPTKYKNMKVYFTAYVLESFYMTMLTLHGYVVHSTLFNGMKTVANKIKLLSLSIEEFENVLAISSKSSDSNLNDNKNYCKEVDEQGYSNEYGNNNHINCYAENCFKIMKNYLVHIVKQHQIIYRNVNTINKGGQRISFTFNSLSSIYVCFSIYYIVHKDEIASKLNESYLCGLALYIIFLFDYSGQRIVTEWEYLRTALYNFNWINKPKWLKKSMLIIITRNNREIEIKPYGLFVLNLKNFALSMNAVYSYYALLNTLKNK